MGDLFATLSLVSQGFVNSIPQKEFLLIEIGMILILCAVLASFSRLIKQPPLFAYVLAGFLIGPAILGFVRDVDIISSLSEIGVAFLVFLAGLEISLKKLRQVNIKKVALIGVLQVALVFLISMFLIEFVNLNFMQGIYVSIILAFSSTMVVLKMLSDKGELITVHGRIVVAILLLQDLFAVFAIVILTSGNSSVYSLIPAILKLFVMVLLAVILQKGFLNFVFKRVALSKHAKELMVLFSLAFLFLFIILSLISGLSIVIGAFIAGVALANLSFKTELESRIKPLRDFFSIIFFVALGMQITTQGIQSESSLFLFLLLGTLILKPIITFLLLRISGYTEKTSFESSLVLGQLSEFSIILGMIGVVAGVISTSMMSAIIIATIVSMSLTVFFSDYENIVYKIFRKPMGLMKFVPIKEHFGYVDNEKKTILLIGCDRMGKIILKDLIADYKDKIQILDHNPEIISLLKKKKISCLYGDIDSPDILEEIGENNFEKVISTVPDLLNGVSILSKIKKQNPDTKVILTAQTDEDALELYKLGADYVMLPRFTAGEIVSNILKKDTNSLKEIRKNQIDRINKLNKLFVDD